MIDYIIQSPNTCKILRISVLRWKEARPRGTCFPRYLRDTERLCLFQRDADVIWEIPDDKSSHYRNDRRAAAARRSGRAACRRYTKTGNGTELVLFFYVRLISTRKVNWQRARPRSIIPRGWMYGRLVSRRNMTFTSRRGTSGEGFMDPHIYIPS